VAAQFAPPALETPQVFLKAVTPDDYPFLRHAQSNAELLFRSRYRGATPSPDQWVQQLWSGRLAQFIVGAQDGNTPIGLVAVYEPNFQQGYAYLSAERFDPSRRSPLMIIGFALFLNYVFSCFDFRKLYMELPEFNYDQFASGEGRYFELEARLRDHSFFGGRYWDELVLAIYQDKWQEGEGRLMLRQEGG
jgi:hypothetical protein